MCECHQHRLLRQTNTHLGLWTHSIATHTSHHSITDHLSISLCVCLFVCVCVHVYVLCVRLYTTVCVRMCVCVRVCVTCRFRMIYPDPFPVADANSLVMSLFFLSWDLAPLVAAISLYVCVTHTHTHTHRPYVRSTRMHARARVRLPTI